MVVSARTRTASADQDPKTPSLLRILSLDSFAMLAATTNRYSVGI